jgi:hypothetical protein
VLRAARTRSGRVGGGCTARERVGLAGREVELADRVAGRGGTDGAGAMAERPSGGGTGGAAAGGAGG